MSDQELEQVTYVEAGIEELYAGNFTEAIALFETAISEQQEVDEAWRGIGLARFRLQDFAGASEALQAALDAEAEETPIIYNLLGISAMKRRDYSEAIRLFEQGILVDDGTETYATVVQEMRFNLIVCYERLLDWEMARVKAQEYIALYPDDEAARKAAEFLETR